MEVIDEPLYANFLRATGIERPYRDELLSKMVRNTRTCHLIFKLLLLEVLLLVGSLSGGTGFFRYLHTR